MQKYTEKKLLNTIKIFPILLLTTFSILVTYFTINHNKKYLEMEIKQTKLDYIKFQKTLIKKEVEKVYSWIEYEYNQNNNSNIQNRLLKKRVLNTIQNVKYDFNGYIFVINFKGEYLVNINKNFLGKNLLNLKDKSGLHVTKEIIKKAKNGGGYLSYVSLEGTYHTHTKKTSYVKPFYPWEWAIGYGFYPSSIESKVIQKQEKLKAENSHSQIKIMLMNFAFTIILIIFLFIYSKLIENRFIKYKQNIDKINEKNRKKDEILFQQSKMATIGEMLNIISHQWRQPLAQINTVTMDIYTDTKTGCLDQKNVKQHISSIENITQYLSNTIDDFSNFYAQEKFKSTFYLKEALDKCINILLPSIKHIQIHVVCKKDKQIHGYISLYQQAIMIILSNALEVFIQRNIDRPMIKIGIDIIDNRSYLSIEDNAEGIKDKYLNKIFDLNFSTKDDKNIRGLGLYICKKIIIKNFKGNIYVDNVNNGTRFTIVV